MRRAFKEDSAHEKTNLRHDRSDDRAAANPIAWAFALAYCVIMVMRMLKKEDTPEVNA